MAIVLYNTAVKFFGVNQTHHLRKNIFTLVHRCSLLCDEVYTSELISNRSQPKYFINN